MLEVEYKGGLYKVSDLVKMTGKYRMYIYRLLENCTNQKQFEAIITKDIANKRGIKCLEKNQKYY